MDHVSSFSSCVSGSVILAATLLVALAAPVFSEEVEGVGLIEVTSDAGVRFGVFGRVECASWRFQSASTQRQGPMANAQLEFDSQGCLVTPPPIDSFYREVELFGLGPALDFRVVDPDRGFAGYLEGEVLVSSNRTPDATGGFDTRFWLEPLERTLLPSGESRVRLRIHSPDPLEIAGVQIGPLNLRDVRHTLELTDHFGGPVANFYEVVLPGSGRHQIVARWGGLTAVRQVLTEAGGGGPIGFCTPSMTAHCLNEGRFRVEADWRNFAGTEGSGTVVPLSEDSGLFWFFDESNIELMVKVIDACDSAFGSYWVFASGLTNVAVDLRVTDTATGEVWSRSTELHDEFGPILDTQALLTCGG